MAEADTDPIETSPLLEVENETTTTETTEEVMIKQPTTFLLPTAEGPEHEEIELDPHVTSSSRRPAGTWFDFVVRMVRGIFYFFALIYLVPLGTWWRSVVYRGFTITSIVLYVLQLGGKFGLPRYGKSMAYIIKILPDPDGINFMMSMVLFFTMLMSRNYFVSMGFLACVEFTKVWPGIAEFLDDHPDVHKKLRPMLRRHIRSIATMDLTTPAFAELMNRFLCTWGCRIEVLHGFYLIAELTTPHRNILGAIVWWQFLQVHCMMEDSLAASGVVKSRPLGDAFRLVDQGISAVVHHQYCPKLVAGGYELFRMFAADKVKLKTVKGPRKSSPCSVM
jgi:hypothetical protein